MAIIPKKVIDRYIKVVPKFQRVLKTAQDRDINEADTVSIIQDMLAEVFGFKKYLEITSEYAIRNTYCDLAIKMDDKIQYLIEVKAIGIELKDSHLRQVIDYGANKGVQWVVLTNGIIWELYKIRFEKPIDHDIVSSFNILEINPRKIESQEKLFLFSKKGINKSVREEYYERVQSVNRFVIGAMILDTSVVNVIKRDLKRISAGIRVESQEIEKILRNEVLKRDIIEGEEAIKATKRLRRLSLKSNKRSKAVVVKNKAASNGSGMSIDNQLSKKDE